MSAVRGSWLFAVAALLLLLGATVAQAQDPNTAPPQVELRAAGQEGILGPKASVLAFFSTTTTDPSGEYAPDSAVSFACAVDALAVPCGGSYGGCCRAAPGSPAPNAKFVPGPFDGSVPVPQDLASGSHTVTVIATDEDGTGPPASVTVSYDTTPPTAPELIQAPPRASHIHKPLFRYTATDDVRLIDKKDDPFRSALRRLDPPEVIFRERREGGYLGTLIPRCPTLLTCTGGSRAVYEGFQRGYSFGVPEWLPPGRYEFSVLARDAVGIKSPLSRYRFRILPGPPRTTG